MSRLRLSPFNQWIHCFSRHQKYGKSVLFYFTDMDRIIRRILRKQGRKICYMNIIAAVDDNWAIGCKGSLLASVPEDMRFFRETTTGHVVVMGRKTLESFPHQRPLKNRVNIVLTKDLSYEKDGTVLVHSEEELKDRLAEYASEEIYVIGGGSIYRQLLDWCDRAYITHFCRSFEADTWLPDLDRAEEWIQTCRTEIKEYEGLAYYFSVYEKSREKKDRQ